MGVGRGVVRSVTRGVRFVGSRPREAMRACYAAADVVCVPSLSDPLPTVVLEAMAAGRPVVGSRVGGIPFMVEEGRTGVIVEPGRPETLAEALRGPVENSGGLRTMGEAAAERAQTVFAWPVIAATIGRLLAEMPPAGAAVR